MLPGPQEPGFESTQVYGSLVSCGSCVGCYVFSASGALLQDAVCPLLLELFLYIKMYENTCRKYVTQVYYASMLEYVSCCSVFCIQSFVRRSFT